MKNTILLIIAAVISMLSGCATIEGAKADFRRLTDRQSAQIENDAKTTAGKFKGARASELSRYSDGSFKSIYVDIPEGSFDPRKKESQGNIKTLRERAREIARDNATTVDFSMSVNGPSIVKSDPQYETAGAGRIRFVLGEDPEVPRKVIRVAIRAAQQQ